MPATLHVIPPSQTAFEVRIGNVASIGRLTDSTVCLSSGSDISRQHAVIRSHDGQTYQIIDLGSLNGTYVNGQRVVVPVKLESGARITIADNEILFEQVEYLSDEFQQSTILKNSNSPGYGTIFAALMVCDIRGFTAATETLAKNDLAQTIGSWFRTSGNLVQHKGGNIDKFMGDAFFAYWAHHEARAQESLTAFEAGLELLQLARGMKWQGMDRPFEVVVALHCGNVTCSNMGVSAERDATIMGNAVNTVFRLESVAKQFSQQLVVSQDFYDTLPSKDIFSDLGEQSLKGKKQPVRVYGLNGRMENG